MYWMVFTRPASNLAPRSDFILVSAGARRRVLAICVLRVLKPATHYLQTTPMTFSKSAHALALMNATIGGDPHQGWLNEVELRRTGGFLPGDGDFWTAHFDLRRFHPLGQTHTLVVATLLSLQSGQPGIDISEYMDFHLGGSNTIRGHSIRELGVYLAGKNQFLGTLEYRFPLLPSREYEILGLASDLGLSAAFFADTGMAWNVKSQVDRNRLHSGIGLGLRLLMPAVDMTRLDVGFDAEGNWQIHFASFSKMRSQRSRLR
jgi:outer membrane protein assembly factor BamA